MVKGGEIFPLSLCTHTFIATTITQGLSHLSVTIIDKANPNEPTICEGFWAYKLDSFIPRGLNQHEFF